jgi:hypothetical protein
MHAKHGISLNSSATNARWVSEQIAPTPEEPIICEFQTFYFLRVVLKPIFVPKSSRHSDLHTSPAARSPECNSVHTNSCFIQARISSDPPMLASPPFCSQRRTAISITCWSATDRQLGESAASLGSDHFSGASVRYQCSRCFARHADAAGWSRPTAVDSCSAWVARSALEPSKSERPSHYNTTTTLAANSHEHAATDAHALSRASTCFARFGQFSRWLPPCLGRTF